MLIIEYFPAQYAHVNNTCNHSAYSPFLFTDDKTIIDVEYYNHLPENLQNTLHAEVNNYYLTHNFVYPHEDQIEHPQYDLLYEIFIQPYREEYWFDPVKDSWPFPKFLIKLTEKDVNDLLTDNFLNILCNKIDNVITNSCKNYKELFFKFSCGSVKHDQSLVPVKTSEDIINKILSSRRLLIDITKSKIYKFIKPHIILSPWIEIDEHCQNEPGKYEFRIFVKDNKARAISQQHWDAKYKYFMNEEREHIYKRIVELINRTNVNRGVCDVWYDKKNDKCWLIEINPFGPGLSSGSASFHWIRDKKILWENDTTDCIWRVIV